MEVLPLTEAHYPEVVAVFNLENEPFEIVARLTLELFVSKVASAAYFNPETCFVAAEDGKVIGFALGTAGCDTKWHAADPTNAAVDGLWFPRDKLRAGNALLQACVEALKARGAKRIAGLASLAGYPFWRGVYAGSEPVCLTAYTHAWVTFMAHGFTHHQQSLTFLGPVEPKAYRTDLEYKVVDLDTSRPWYVDSWKGLQPRELEASMDGEKVGRVGFVQLPWIAERRGVQTAGIYGMTTSPNLRRQGIASSMINRMFEIVRAEGAKDLIVGTTCGNFAARATYEKVGLRNFAFRTGTRLDIA